MQPSPTDNKETIKQLNSFLRGEISAVETYRQASQRLHDSLCLPAILEGMRSHEERVGVLRQAIRSLDGEPAESSGVWGAFAKLVEGGAKLFGERAAVAALEEGEDHGRDDYSRDVRKLAPPMRQLVELQILPEQQRTHDAISALKR